MATGGSSGKLARDGTVSAPTADADADLAAGLRVAVTRLARRLRRHAVVGLTPSQLPALTSVERLGPVRLGDLAGDAHVAGAVPLLDRLVDEPR